MAGVAEATPEQWDEYREQVIFQMSLVDKLSLENKELVWEHGFDAVVVRRMLADQKRAARGLPPKLPRP